MEEHNVVVDSGPPDHLSDSLQLRGQISSSTHALGLKYREKIREIQETSELATNRHQIKTLVVRLLAIVAIDAKGEKDALPPSRDMGKDTRFISSQRHLPDASVQSYRLVESRRKALRLVCNTWKELLDRRHQRWLLEGSDIPEGELTGLERIDFSLTLSFMYSQRFGNGQKDIHLVL
ncbi:9248_t:CDS:2, partial [Acaulospora colombiana]